MREKRNNVWADEKDKALWLMIEDLANKINYSNKSWSNRELIGFCSSYAGFFQSLDPHFYHEIAEAAINLLIKKQYAVQLEDNNNAPETNVAATVKSVAGRLPTQTWRSWTQTTRQQFSTPPHIALLLWHLMNCKESEKVLEPSAGTGSLVVWCRNEIYCNEIDVRRRVILRTLGFAPTAFNAEFINDYLPPEIQPDCLIMNPPFSSSGGRTKNNSSKFGFRHVESALERLKKGGKFGVILGEAGGLDTKTGNDFWRKLSDRIEVNAVIKIDGREYAKNGTTVDINLIIGRKFSEPQKTDWNQALNKITCFSVNTIEEAFAKVSKFNLRFNR
jgi:type I restriction-modification system DNA methylase subunit